MPPQLNFFALSRPIVFRPRTSSQWRAQPVIRTVASQCRAYSDSKDPAPADRSKRNDAKPLDHVSEEAAQTAKIMGEEGPDVNQGTPVEEVSRFVED